MIRSTTQPFCRLCGKPLRKWTETHWFGHAVDGMSIGVAHPDADPKTKTEAQRHVNQQIVSVRHGYRGLVATAWDGESYRAEHGYFCTNQCAGEFGRFAVLNCPTLETQNYYDATHPKERR